MTDINRSSLLSKLKHIKGMKLLVEQAILLYLLMTDEQTPMWVKTIVVSALAYLLCPVDAIPDFLPGVGLTDDLGAPLQKDSHLAPLDSRLRGSDGFDAKPVPFMTLGHGTG